MEHTRAALRRLVPRVGDAIYSTRRRPLVTLVQDTSPGVHDTLIAACDPERYRLLGGAARPPQLRPELRRRHRRARPLAAPRPGAAQPVHGHPVVAGRRAGVRAVTCAARATASPSRPRSTCWWCCRPARWTSTPSTRRWGTSSCARSRAAAPRARRRRRAPPRAGGTPVSSDARSMRSCTVCIPAPLAHPIPTAGIPSAAAALASVEPAPNVSPSPSGRRASSTLRTSGWSARDLTGAAAPHHLALQRQRRLHRQRAQPRLERRQLRVVERAQLDEHLGRRRDRVDRAAPGHPADVHALVHQLAAELRSARAARWAFRGRARSGRRAPTPPAARARCRRAR